MGFLELFLNTKKWHIRNEENGETIEGQFPAEALTLEVRNNYAEHTSLNRQNPVTQYLNGQADTVTFNSLFHARDFTASSKTEDKINKLISWARRDPELGRPPIVTFWTGNGHLEQLSVIDSISGIEYGEPSITGGIKQVKFTVKLRQYVEFNLGDTEASDTRYHRSREREYYEMLTYQQYGDPLIGDIIRKRNPATPTLVAGTIVALPSKSGIRTEKVTPTSIPLKTITGRLDTPQKLLRASKFDNHNVSYTSHILV
jgi:hypothetical protein